MYPRLLPRCLNWARSHGSCSVEFEEEGDKVRVFLRTWDVDTFRRVCVATLDRYSSDLHREVTALGRMLNCVLSTVAARSVIGQGLSCFCPAIVVGGDDVAPLQLFNKLLDGLLEKGGTRGSEVEACRAEYQSFVQEQWQLERSSTRSRPDVGDFLLFCSGYAGFRAPRHLYKVFIVAKQACGISPCELSLPFMQLCSPGVTVDDACDPWVFNTM